MLLLAISNSLLGAVCGFGLRAPVLGFLVTVALIEVAFLKHLGTWWWAFRGAIILMCALEVGYLIGSSVDSFWLTSVRGRAFRDLLLHWHGRLSRR
jgi:hypothetical protein